MTKKTRKTPTSKVDYEAMPPQPMEGQVTDRRAQFRTLTRSAPTDRASDRAFLASKLTMLRMHPGLTQRERAEGEAMLARGQWSDWHMLAECQSTIQNDSRGFSPVFIDPNYSLVVKS